MLNRTNEHNKFVKTLSIVVHRTGVGKRFFYKESSINEHNISQLSNSRTGQLPSPSIGCPKMTSRNFCYFILANVCRLEDCFLDSFWSLLFWQSHLSPPGQIGGPILEQDTSTINQLNIMTQYYVFASWVKKTYVLYLYNNIIFLKNIWKTIIINVLWKRSSYC